ncbi:MAG: NAD(P)-binding domain-containing protein, partial [Burkholderiaceae bacterium]|nr:NAD(P)-binding domain-containing protein [Burkholderiaceae bacterium]
MKVAFIGGGNMAGALISGMRDSGFGADAIQVLEIDQARGDELARRHQINVHTQSGPWLSTAEAVVLAVKPQQMQQAATSIKSDLARPLVLSIAAGVRATQIAGWLGTRAVVRAMPNMPALIRAGISGAVALADVSAEQRSAADRILSAVGSVI